MDAYYYYYKMHCFCFFRANKWTVGCLFPLPNQAYDGPLSFSPVSLLVSGNYRQDITQLVFFFYLFYNYLN